MSRVPVIGENLDDVLGMAYLKDVTKRVFDNHVAESTEKVDSIMRPCLFVPDTKPADDLLKERVPTWVREQLELHAASR